MLEFRGHNTRGHSNTQLITNKLDDIQKTYVQKCGHLYSQIEKLSDKLCHRLLHLIYILIINKQSN